MVPTSRIQIVTTEFPRPDSGPVFVPENSNLDCEFSGLPAWQSNGGPHRGHPARSLPFSVEAKLNSEYGQMVRIHLLGIFSLFAGREEEAIGTLGATVHVTNSREAVFRQDLLNGRHYFDAHDLSPLSIVNGDGTNREEDKQAGKVEKTNHQF